MLKCIFYTVMAPFISSNTWDHSTKHSVNIACHVKPCCPSFGTRASEVVRMKKKLLRRRVYEELAFKKIIQRQYLKYISSPSKILLFGCRWEKAVRLALGRLRSSPLQGQRGVGEGCDQYFRSFSKVEDEKWDSHITHYYNGASPLQGIHELLTDLYCYNFSSIQFNCVRSADQMRRHKSHNTGTWHYL